MNGNALKKDALDRFASLAVEIGGLHASLCECATGMSAVADRKLAACILGLGEIEDAIYKMRTEICALKIRSREEAIAEMTASN